MPLWGTIKIIPHKHEAVTNKLKIKHKITARGLPNRTLCPLGRLFYLQLKNQQNLDNKTKMTFCWKYLYNSQNNCEGLTQWVFVLLVPTLIYITSNLKNLINCLESNQCIDDDRWNYKTGNLATTFHKPTGEANPYVRFGYVPMKIFQYTLGQVSGSMNSYPINVIHTLQQSTE